MKRYLNKPEEVIKALREGKEVKSDDGYRYKMIDGVICSLFDKGWVIGPSFDDEEKLYLEEAEPLKFEVGKFYKNRNGRKHICCFVSNRKHEVYPVTFVDITSGAVFKTTLTGRDLLTQETESDIIGEWEE